MKSRQSASPARAAAMAAPSLRPRARSAVLDILQAQAAVAHPRTASPQTLLSVQRAFGNRALQRLLAPLNASETRGPVVQRAADMAVLPMGPDGGVAGPALERRITAASGGVPLPPGARAPMEQRMGADFSGVRIHTGSESEQLNRALGARAFTHGAHIFMGEGRYDPGSAGGRRLLAHELTHVVQQGGADVARTSGPRADLSELRPPARSVARRVQRDVGFEFETKGLMTKRSNGPLLPAAGFADAGTAAAAFNDPAATRIAKGAQLLRHNTGDMTVEADDCTGGSDLEVVTTHFPETAPGRARLATVMADLAALVAASTPIGAPAAHHVPARALDGNNNFTIQMADAMWVGDWSVATSAPQVTAGMRVGNIGDIVKDLHGAPGETAPEQAARDPGRTRFRRPDAADATQPRALGPGEETQTLIDGAGLAHQAVAAYQGAHAGAPGGPELEGILTIMYTYREGVQHKGSFLKQHTPLMAKTDLAAIWTTLPGPVQTYYGHTNTSGVTRLEQLFAMAPGYAGLMDLPLFNVVAPLDENDNLHGPKQWYHKLKMRSWVRGIALRNHSAGEALKQFFRSGKGGTFRRGVDQLRTANFPDRPANQQVEGYGALGANMDADATNPATLLPVFELRAANRLIRYADLGPWALEVFDYIQSLNANPNGGHARMGARAGYGM